VTVQHLHQKRHRLRKLRGESAYVDATSARLHLATLLGAGWSIRSIAGLSGVPASTLSRLNLGHQTKASPDTLRKLLTVDPAQVPTRTNRPGAEPFVSRIGTTRRLQALLYLGWGHQQMRDVCGLNTANLMHQQGRWVTRSTHDAVAAMYRELSTRRGPSSKAATYAQQRGYRGPTDWQDIDHDAEPDDVTDEMDEHDDIDSVAIDRVMSGDRTVRLSKAERTELVRRWTATGRPLNEMERVTGINTHRYLDGPGAA
jgi:hypothetical protein